MVNNLTLTALAIFGYVLFAAVFLLLFKFLAWLLVAAAILAIVVGLPVACGYFLAGILKALFK